MYISPSDSMEKNDVPKITTEMIAQNVDNVTVSAEVNCSFVCDKFCVSYFAEQNDTLVSLLSCAVPLKPMISGTTCCIKHVGYDKI